MAHLDQVLNAAGTVRFGPISGHVSNIIGFPAPGDGDTGGIAGIVLDVIRRLPIPIPRPRLPAPKPGPGGGPGRFPFPFPIPFPVPSGGVLGDGTECPTCCKGFHIAKTTDQSSPSFGQCVRNRRMNPLNPKALRRAIRRATRFESFVKSNRKSLRKLAKI